MALHAFFQLNKVISLFLLNNFVIFAKKNYSPVAEQSGAPEATWGAGSNMRQRGKPLIYGGDYIILSLLKIVSTKLLKLV